MTPPLVDPYDDPDDTTPPPDSHRYEDRGLLVESLCILLIRNMLNHQTFHDSHLSNNP